MSLTTAEWEELWRRAKTFEFILNERCKERVTPSRHEIQKFAEAVDYLKTKIQQVVGQME